jgi:hypothetical protein
MKRYILLLAFCLVMVPLFSQHILWATPAKMQVYAMKLDGSQAVMTNENVAISYNDLKMYGELYFENFRSEDVLLQNLLDSAETGWITFTGVIPEGRFAFTDVLEQQFPVETELHYGDRIIQIILDFTVSNRNTSLANTFDITVTGSVSLKDDLGVTRDTGLEDKISFMFFQNIQVRNY